ncbi:uncharacterized protein LOC123555487 [Mercenaria mercenaria]|uniref:uncharacterized protein LOC123555487 n=1 Tax=Mercenaria mercenaria TaxID=6596 RepID=UPI00234F542F|nr:uncharacterized protein LOC123555487 [Mercenaria mercenaria]
MELQLAFRFLFLTSIDLFSLKVFANVKNIEYKRTFGNDNYNDIICGAEKSENIFVAVKISQDSNGQCQALERDWLLNKQYDSGYDYIEKEKVVEIFNPPQEIDFVEIDPTDTYKWILPSSFDVGASLTLYVTIPIQPFDQIKMNIVDTIKENLDITDSDPEIVLHHLVFRHNNAHVNYFKNEWGTAGSSVTPQPITNGKTHAITFEAHADFIRTVIDGTPTLTLEHAVPPKSAAILEIRMTGSSPLYIHNITMNGVV